MVMGDEISTSILYIGGVLSALISPDSSISGSIPSGSITQDGCDYELKYTNGNESRNLDTFEDPLIFEIDHGDFNLLRPEGGRLRIKRGKGVFFTCSGERNSFRKIPYTRFIHGTCYAGIFITAEGFFRRSELKCIKPHETVIQNNAEKNVKPQLECPYWAASYSIGYRVNDFTFMSLIELCRLKASFNTFYTKHTITPESLDSTNEIEGLPLHLDKLYARYQSKCDIRKAYSETRMNTSRSSALGRYNLEDGSFLVPGQLVPPEDFYSIQGAHATLLYENTAPQHHMIDDGHWKLLEITLREYAKIYGTDLHVYTGIDSQLNLPGDERLSSECLQTCKSCEDLMVVPGYFWKIVVDKRHRKALGFVVSNNPAETDSKKYCNHLNNGTNPKWFPPVSAQMPESGRIVVCDPVELSFSLPYPALSRALIGITQYLEDLDVNIVSKQITKPVRSNNTESNSIEPILWEKYDIYSIYTTQTRIGI